MEPVNETEESAGITETHRPRHLRTSGLAATGALRGRGPESAPFLVFGIALASTRSPVASRTVRQLGSRLSTWH